MCSAATALLYAPLRQCARTSTARRHGGNCPTASSFGSADPQLPLRASGELAELLGAPKPQPDREL
eukprot:8487967-Alexandrium_andersonii.AAC.1